MNSTEVVRWDAFADGVRLTVWTYGDNARFLAAGTLWIECSMVEAFAAEVAAEQEDASQYQFEFNK